MVEYNPVSQTELNFLMKFISNYIHNLKSSLPFLNVQTLDPDIFLLFHK